MNNQEEQNHPLKTLDSVDGAAVAASLAALMLDSDFYRYLTTPGKILYAVEHFVGTLVLVPLFWYFFRSVVNWILKDRVFYNRLSKKWQNALVYICLFVVFAATLFFVKGILGLE